MRALKRQYNRWIICAGCTLLLFCTVGLTTTAFSVYQPYLISHIGLSNTQASMVTTVRSLFSVISVFCVQAYLTRVGLRWGVALATAGAAAAFFLYGISTGVVGCCVAAAVAGMSYGLGGMVPVSIIINRVFRDHQGLALGICAAGSGAAAMVLPPIVTALIEGGTFRRAAWWEAAFIVACAVIVLLTVRGDFSRSAQSGTPTAARKNGPVPRAEQYSVGLVLVAVALIGTLAGPSLAHLSVLYTSEGMDSERVAWLISFSGLALMVGKCVYGQAADRMGGRHSCYLFGALMVLGQLLACFAGVGGLATAVPSMLCMGLGLPLSTVGLSVLAVDLVAPQRYDSAVKNFQMVFMLGSLLSGPMPGMIADVTGSYVPAYVVLFLFSALALVLICVAYVVHARLKQPAAQ